MKKQTKKFLSVILAILLIVSVPPVAFAEESCNHVFDYTAEYLTRPAQNGDGTWSDGYYLYECLNGCGASEKKYVKRADYSELESTVDSREFQLPYNCVYEDNQKLAEINDMLWSWMFGSYFNAIMYERIESEQYIVDLATAELKEFIKEVNLALAEGSLVIILDTSEFYGYLLDISDKLEAGVYDGINLENEEFKNELASAMQAAEDIHNAQKYDLSKSYQAEFDVATDRFIELFTQFEACVNGTHDTTGSSHKDNGDGTHTVTSGCPVCGAISVTQAHIYGAYLADGNATCVSFGTKTASCTVCGAENTVTDDSAKGEHNYGTDNICDDCGEVRDCSHLCHKTGFMGFIWKIVRFFTKLFKTNPVCECGAAHY